MDTEKIIDYFKVISRIPRSSGDEKAISDYIAGFAREKGFPVIQDQNYNLIISKPATAKSIGTPVILQGHLDMVYVKENGSSHVYEEGIEVEEDDEYYFASGTSLGADNGIAIAYCLGLLDSNDIPHPDLEMVFTVREEEGLAGAKTIDISSLKGTRLINLDSEEEGIFYTSCAGGLRSRMIWKVETERLPEEMIVLEVVFRGLAGGHSGDNIGMGLGNAIVLLGRLLYFLKDMPVRVHKLDFPGKANAIANSGSLHLCVRPADLDAVKARIKEIEKLFQEELRYTDTVSFELTECERTDGAEAYTEEYEKKIRDSLMLIPYGVAGYSFAVEGLVETSMNMGALTMEDGKLTLLMAIRSSVASQKYFLRDKIQIIAERNCDECVFESDYPGWEYRKDSPLRDTAVAVYERVFHKEARTAAIHAGLECGYWAHKKPGIDLISTGPDLFEVHSPREKASRKSVERTWIYLKELLKELI